MRFRSSSRFRNPTILTASAMGILLALGAVNNASAGHGGYPRSRMTGYMPHPIYGQPSGAMHGKGYGNPHGKDGSCGSYDKTGYMVKTGMRENGMTEAAAPAGDIVDVAVEMVNIRMRKKRAEPVVLHGPKPPAAE